MLYIPIIALAIAVVFLGLTNFRQRSRIEFLKRELDLALKRAPTHINTIVPPPPLNERAQAIARECEKMIVRLNQNEGAD